VTSDNSVKVITGAGVCPAWHITYKSLAAVERAGFTSDAGRNPSMLPAHGPGTHECPRSANHRQRQYHTCAQTYAITPQHSTITTVWATKSKPAYCCNNFVQCQPTSI